MPTPATVYLSESNGAGEVVTDNVSNLNFGGADVPNLVPANHPVIKPGASLLRFNCYFKSLRIKVQSLGDSIQIQDLRTWKALGAYMLEEGIFFNNPDTGYSQPSQTSMAGGLIATADPGAANLYTKSPASLAPIVAAPAYNPYFFFQWGGNDANGGTTPIGAMNQKTLVFTYDES